MIKFRKLDSADKATIAEWIANDPFHRGTITHEFFYGFFFSFAVEDKDGTVMFAALEPRPPAMVFHIQFGVSRGRTARTFLEGFPTMKQECLKCGATEMVFETKNPELAAFSQRAWGFRHVEGTDDWKLSLQEPLAGETK